MLLRPTAFSMKRLLIVTTLFFSCWPLVLAQAKDCADDSIGSVSDDGSIVKMLSGAVFEIDSVDQVDSELWLTADDVLVCADIVEYKGKPRRFYTIINTDEDGEKVDADRLR
jgi:hypothetical protein